MGIGTLRRARQKIAEKQRREAEAAAADEEQAEESPPEPEPAEEPAAEDGDPRAGYEVEQSGTWYKLIGPDGEQVGKSQRSEEDAWALLDPPGGE